MVGYRLWGRKESDTTEAAEAHTAFPNFKRGGPGGSQGAGESPLLSRSGGALVTQMVKNLPAMRETWVPSLGREDPLEKEMVTHSSILAWRIPWMEKPGRLQSTGSQRVGHD